MADSQQIEKWRAVAWRRIGEHHRLGAQIKKRIEGSPELAKVLATLERAADARGYEGAFRLELLTHIQHIAAYEQKTFQPITSFHRVLAVPQLKKLRARDRQRRHRARQRGEAPPAPLSPVWADTTEARSITRGGERLIWVARCADWLRNVTGLAHYAELAELLSAVSGPVTATEVQRFVRRGRAAGASMSR